MAFDTLHVSPACQLEGSQSRYLVEMANPVDKSWDMLVSSFCDACLEQSACYMASRWNASRLCGLVMRNSVSGEAEAIALAVIVDLPVLGAGLAYIKFGPLWKRRGEPIRPHVLRAALAAINKSFVAMRGYRCASCRHRILIMPRPGLPNLCAPSIDCENR